MLVKEVPALHNSYSSVRKICKNKEFKNSLDKVKIDSFVLPIFDVADIVVAPGIIYQQ